MKKKQSKEKRAYVEPTVEVIYLEPHSELMATSFPNNGGHNKAEDDETLNAKQGWFDEENLPTPSEERENFLGIESY